jgi:hypothetical protein
MPTKFVVRRFAPARAAPTPIFGSFAALGFHRIVFKVSKRILVMPLVANVPDERFVLPKLPRLLQYLIALIRAEAFPRMRNSAPVESGLRRIELLWL